MQRVKNICAATWENAPSDMCCQWRLKSACVFAAWSVFVAHMIELCILGYPECTQWWFWSDCSNAQADLYLRWVCMCEGMFADNLQLNCFHLFQYSNNGRMSVSIYGPKVIKLFSCSTQLSMKFFSANKNENISNSLFFFCSCSAMFQLERLCNC